MTVYLVTSLPKLPYIYKVLATPFDSPFQQNYKSQSPLSISILKGIETGLVVKAGWHALRCAGRGGSLHAGRAVWICRCSEAMPYQ